MSADPRTTVAVFVGGYPPAFRGGGPIRAVHALANRCPAGIRPIVLTSDRDLGSTARLPVIANQWAEVDGIQVYYASIDRLPQLWRGFRAIRAQRPDILHFNSFFYSRLTIAPILLWLIGYWGKAKIVLSPRGEFAEAALAKSAGRKKVYLALFRALGLQRKMVWHATAAHEAADIARLWGSRVEVVHASDTVLLPPHAERVNRATDPTVRTIAVGRVVTHKGLHIALQALQQCTGNLHLDVVGAAEDPQYLEQCERLVEQLPPGVSVAFRGERDHAEITSALAAADLLIFPTASENFGYVVPEALSVSCPVMVPPTTGWTALVESGAGILVPDRKPQSWADAINAFVTLRGDQRRAMCDRAADAYDRWLAAQDGQHLWEQAAARR